jgi:dehydrogenase/reductase SDR family member 1
VALDSTVCIVTGASRGIGRGIAVGLAQAGARVHITGRTKFGRFQSEHEWREGSLDSVVEEIGAFGGACTAHQVDHRDPDATRAVIAGIVQAEGWVDLLVNNAWGGYERMEEDGEFTWFDPFWKQPLWRWDAMVNASLLPAYVCSQVAAAAMVEQGRGLIVNISFWAAQKPMGNVVYGMAKAAVDKLSADMAHALRPHGVCALSLYPGLVRTEAVMRNAHHFDLSNSESPEFLGRIVAGLAQDPGLMERSGTVQVAAALGLAYGIRDIDGRVPQPLTMETA